MEIVHAREPLPTSVTRSIFLAGPTPRSPDVPSFRPALLAELAKRGFDGTVFVPEPRSGVWASGYEDQIAWEEAALNRADVIAFWVPREMSRLPGLTTNVEWGMWMGSGKVVFGAPKEADHVRYLQHYARDLHVPVASDLPALVTAVIQKLGDGVPRSGGECEVPLHVFRHPTFQGWYAAQRRAGNRLDGARVLWTYFVGKDRSLLFTWALRAIVHVAAEGRQKREIVIGRTDTSSVLLYRPGPTLLDTEVLLVREFRNAARTDDGFVHELPGGSSWKEGEDPIAVAQHEVEEETGFRPKAIHPVAARQLAATLLAHEAALFAAELSADDVAALRAGLAEVRGVEEDGERTYNELMTVREILEGKRVDWTTIGMILSVLVPRFAGK